MAFATQSNIATADTLLINLVAFAVANAGFTDEGTTTVAGTNQSGIMYRMSKTVDGQKTYWYFYYASNWIWGSDTQYVSRMMTVLPTDANKQDSTVGQYYHTLMGLWDFTPTFTGYSFFTDGASVFVALEVSVGIFAHMCLGHIEKVAAFVGGAFLQANSFNGSTGTWYGITSANTGFGSAMFGCRQMVAGINYGGCYLHYVDAGTGGHGDFSVFGRTDVGRVSGMSGTLTPTNGTTDIAHTSTVIKWAIWQKMMDLGTPSASTLRSPLLPIYVVRAADYNTGEFQLIGKVPNIACVNVAILQNKELVNTDWRVFPMTSKIVDSTVVTHSGIYGVAYREIT